MNEGPKPEHWLESGDKEMALGELDEAIHCYNQALKQNLEDPRINFKLAEAYDRKSEKADKAYRVLAMNALRRGLKTDPRNEAAHGKLMALALKTGTLDALAREYRDKLAADPDDGFYAGQLKRTYLFSMLDNSAGVRPAGYKPAAFIKYFFDLLILPAGVIGIMLNNFGPRFKPAFALGISFFFFYCFYRVTILILARRR